MNGLVGGQCCWEAWGPGPLDPLKSGHAQGLRDSLKAHSHLRDRTELN